MNHRFLVDPSTGWGEVHLRGEVRPDDLQALLQAAWRDPAFAVCEKAIWNLIDAHTDISLDELMALSHWLCSNKQGRGARYVAMVAPQDLMFGLSRMFDAVTDTSSLTVRVFRDEPSARAWLRAATGDAA